MSALGCSGRWRRPALAAWVACAAAVTGVGVARAAPIRVEQLTPGNPETWECFQVGGSSGTTGPPVLAQSVAAAPVSGQVLVREPGAHTFVSLTRSSLVVVGTTVNASDGRVRLTIADATGHGTRAGEFHGGEFRVTQTSSGLAKQTLTGGTPCAAGAARTTRAPARQNKLWGSAHGGFQTSGRYAAGTDLGTRWLTKDTCAPATLIRVASGAVRVHDLVTGHTLLLRAPNSYLAHP
jgi:hypothetical protein